MAPHNIDVSLFSFPGKYLYRTVDPEASILFRGKELINVLLLNIPLAHHFMTPFVGSQTHSF